jgi:catechol 2,3-dioxygenase-like lactoylglutathione lyase family enzyme
MKRALLAIAILFAAVAPAAAAGPILAVDEVAITVSDAHKLSAFYHDVLGFHTVGETELATPELAALEGVFGAHVRIVRMRLGDEKIALIEYVAPAGRPVPADSRSNDRWFQHLAIVVRDMDAAYRVLRAHKVAHVSSNPQELPAWNRAAGGIKAFYFRDPDGHTLELIWFPKGKGDPRWQRATGDALFLGIDHTAIAVADTDDSLRLYRDQLGLRIAGESDNYGSEQEHLNAVFGAHLRITALRAPAGPGIELLEYLAPRDGRPTPVDVRANDLVHWQTTLRVRGLGALDRELRGVRHVSSAVSAGVPPYGRADLVRDTDGHALLLAEP